MTLQKTDGQIAKARKEWIEKMTLEQNIRQTISRMQIDQLVELRDLTTEVINNRIFQTRGAAVQQQEAEAKRAVPRMAEEMGGISQDTCDKPKMHVSESGATSSHVPLRYDLIPRSLLERAVKRYTLGAKVHGVRGYQQGLLDRDFIINRINHVTEHWNKLWHPDFSKAEDPDSEEGITLKSANDNLGAIIWGVGFICEVLDIKGGFELIRELRSQGRVKITQD